MLADAPIARGAVWAPDDTIIYSPATDAGLWRVPAAGGTPSLLAQPDSAKGERSYRWPALLPGGDDVMFTVAMSDILSFDDARLAVRSLRTGEQHKVVRGGSFGTYVTTGHLLYARAGALLAVPFDVKQGKVTGTPTPVLDDLVTYPGERRGPVRAVGERHAPVRGRQVRSPSGRAIAGLPGLGRPPRSPANRRIPGPQHFARWQPRGDRHRRRERRASGFSIRIPTAMTLHPRVEH